MGCYEVLSLLGAGGMGEVYRARDTRLKRDVALKILPSDFINDPQRMMRFEREAQLLAALNHPSIASIYGLEESSGTRALVMELVEGPTLAERIRQGPLPLEEALLLARQIAVALEYAHERGIIHRDLKPANIKLARDGGVKVLDFGLAKALFDESSAADVSSSPTFSDAATRAGIILGTAAYMSPEQARGKAVDRRVDVWSFGCVLFEMLTGKPAFVGETVSDTLAAVLTKEPESERLPPETPPAVRRLLERCLQKDLKKRLQAIGDARIEIEDSVAGKDSAGAPGVSENAEQRRPSRWFGPAAAIGAGLFLTVVAGLMVFLVRGRTSRTPTWTADMIPGPNVAFGPRISPDGHILAFQAMIGNLTQVAVASPDTGNWTLLTHDRQHGFVNEISWAPDGSKLYYDRVTAVPIGIYSVPALGGEERLVLENAGTPEALPDGSLLVIHRDPNGRWRINHYWPDLQRLEPLSGWVSIDTTIALRVFPDGKEAAFYGMASRTEATAQLYALDVATGKTRRLLTSAPRLTYNEGYPIAAVPDGRSVLVDTPEGELHRIVAVPRSGSGRVQTVLTLTSPPWYMDTAKDGTLYVDMMDRPHEILRYPVSGGVPEVIGHADTFVMAGQYMEPVQASNGLLLLDSRFSGRRRMLIGKPGGDFFPLLDTREESAGPANSLANNEVALVVGSENDAQVVIASVAEGRMIRRLQGTKGKHIVSLAASSDSKTLYFAAEGFIWSIPVSDGTPLKITVGDCVTANPNGQELIVMGEQTSSPFLTRVATAGGEAKKIQIESGFSLSPVPLGSRGMSQDGKLLVTISPTDSWFYRVAVLDPATGRITPVNVTYPGDTISANWGEDGRILAVGLPLKGRIWRFHRTTE